jgi:acetyl-CoA carboxylase biotin carboxyl carrier protein
MAELRIVARVEEEEPGRAYLVRSPLVGVVDEVPQEGIYLNPMKGFLTLKVLGRRHVVLLPRQVQGWVVERMVQGTHCPVEYDQPLCRLRVGMDVAEQEQQQAAGGPAGAADADLITVPAPSEGIFYRRPSPDAPAYVEQGDRVTSGAVLGLVEVMKSFNQILYGGPGFPESATVAAIKVEDAAEVTFGQPLFLIKPE